MVRQYRVWTGEPENETERRHGTRGGTGEGLRRNGHIKVSSGITFLPHKSLLELFIGRQEVVDLSCSQDEACAQYYIGVIWHKTYLCHTMSNPWSNLVISLRRWRLNSLRNMPCCDTPNAARLMVAPASLRPGITG